MITIGRNWGAAAEASEANEAACMCNAQLSCDSGIHYKFIDHIQSLWKVGTLEKQNDVIPFSI